MKTSTKFEILKNDYSTDEMKLQMTNTFASYFGLSPNFDHQMFEIGISFFPQQTWLFYDITDYLFKNQN